MQITVKVKLSPTVEQGRLINKTTTEYICLVNKNVADFVAADRCLPYTSKDVVAPLPSAY